MKNSKFNILISILIISMVIIRVLNKSYFIIVNNYLWLFVSVILLIVSIKISINLNFIQLRFIKIIKSLFKKTKKNTLITNRESLCISMAGRIGVGSLSGIALAIFIAGPGVIFWMWISSIVLSILTYCESYLGVLYQKKEQSILKSGPSYYIKEGLNNKYLAMIYAILIILAYIVGFLGIQSNTIVKSVINISNYNPILISTILCLITMYSIFNDTKKLVSITNYLVPIMTVIYILLGMYIIINNHAKIINILITIIKSALNIKTTLVSIILVGIQRAVFASESGIGSSAIASGSTSDTPNNQGLLQLFGVHFTTLIICTITALIVLNSNYQNITGNINGIEIMILAFYNNFGKLGSILLCIITILFAYSTIISGYFFGENSLSYINNNLSNKSLIIFKIISLILIFIGGIISSNIIWGIVDLFTILLTIINTYAIYKLRKKIVNNKL